MGTSGGGKSTFNYGVDPNMASQLEFTGAGALVNSQAANLPALVNSLTASTNQQTAFAQQAQGQNANLAGQVENMIQPVAGLTAQAGTAIGNAQALGGQAQNTMAGEANTMNNLLGINTMNSNSSQNNSPTGAPTGAIVGAPAPHPGQPKAKPTVGTIMKEFNGLQAGAEGVGTAPGGYGGSSGSPYGASAGGQTTPIQNAIGAQQRQQQQSTATQAAIDNLNGTNAAGSNFNPTTGYSGAATQNLTNQIEGNPVFQAQYNIGMQGMQRQLSSGAYGGVNSGAAINQAENYGQALAGNVYTGLVSNEQNNINTTNAGLSTQLNASNATANAATGLVSSYGQALSPLANAYGSATSGATSATGTASALMAANAATTNTAQNQPATTAAAAYNTVAGYTNQDAISQGQNNAAVAGALIGAMM